MHIKKIGGFLHQFHENDKVNPELSIFIPKSTIIPSIDMSQLSTQYHQHLHPSGDEYTFEIRRSGALQRDKVYILRAKSREELIGWCQLLIDIATKMHHGHSATWKKIQRKSTMLVNEEGQEQIQQDPFKPTKTTVHRSISNASNRYTHNSPALHQREQQQQQQQEEDTVLLYSPTTPSSASPAPKQDSLAKARSTITSIIDDYDGQKRSRNNSNSNNDGDDDGYQIVKKLDKGKSRSKDLPERINQVSRTSTANDEKEGTVNNSYNSTNNNDDSYDNYLNSRAQVVEPGHAVHAQLQHKNTFPPPPIHSNSSNSMSINTTTFGVNNEIVEDDNQKTPTRASIPVMHAITTDIPITAAGSVERITPRGKQDIDDSKKEKTLTTPVRDENNKQEALSITDIKESTISNDIIKENDQQAPQRTSMIMSSFVSYLPQLTTFSSQKNHHESTISNRSSQSFESFPQQSSSEDTRHQ